MRKTLSLYLRVFSTYIPKQADPIIPPTINKAPNRPALSDV